ncbi:ATP-binding cassette domain-containing protein [Nitrosovibrio tenuis]|uniref:Putative ABC transport system ATP-binding protein n=1 Tax=Nitrosovibrio tenuis TaxID=1233 RepID=A0A1H7IUU7_9PROT|nr:ATP-binding cassette domain-containing protein [Nitrosovibrio tenuis]SEK66283.1 putative ABC transport system ATP-binding protein [Nitrosovibrio tenuis]
MNRSGMGRSGVSEFVIDIENLVFQWPGRNGFRLSIPQFKVKPGERIFLQGASGSGKSTLLGLLGGVLLPQPCRLRVLDTDMTALTSSARDRFRVDHVGFLFQQFNLVPYLSVRENVLLPCRFSPRRRQRSLEAAGTNAANALEQSADRLLAQLGLDAALARQPATALSVGQQQRVAAARALIGHPELIIADEPTSALDSDRQAEFLDLLLERCENENVTLIFVSHDERLAQHFTRSIHLNELRG